MPDEPALLTALFAAIRELDPDVLVGWNVVDFDLAVLERRCGAHGVAVRDRRARESARVITGASGQIPIARVPGRVVLDGIATLKSATHRFERFTLDHVARELLGRGKAIAKGTDPVAEIRRMYEDDPAALAAYNLEDCRLVLDIFDRAHLVEFAMERARLTGLPMDRPGGLGRRVRSPLLASSSSEGLRRSRRRRRRGLRRQPRRPRARLRPGPLRGSALVRLPEPVSRASSERFASIPLGLHQPGEDPHPGRGGRDVRAGRGHPPRADRDAPRRALAGHGRQGRGAVAGHQDPHELVLWRARDAGLPLLRPPSSHLDHPPWPRGDRARARLLRRPRPPGPLRGHRLPLRAPPAARRGEPGADARKVARGGAHAHAGRGDPHRPSRARVTSSCASNPTTSAS